MTIGESFALTVAIIGLVIMGFVFGALWSDYRSAARPNLWRDRD